MVVTIDRVAPVAHLPLVLGVLRKLDVAGLVDALIVPHPDQVVSAGRAVEALVLSILDGHHALYKVGRRLDERGMLARLAARAAAMYAELENGALRTEIERLERAIARDKPTAPANQKPR